ncbi:DUF4382 domain-containing protein [Chloroflexota bacterium]
MHKSRLYSVIVILSMLALLMVACAQPAPAPTPAPVPIPIPTPTTTGTLEMRATDAPPTGISSIMVTTDNIEVHKAEATEDTWITVVDEEKTFDLVEIQGAEVFLGQKEIATGKYTQIRLDVIKVMVTVDGKELDATLPSDKLKVIRPWEIIENEKTILTLDFEADKFVVITGKDRAQVKPVLKLEVTKGERPLKTPAPTPALKINWTEVDAPPGVNFTDAQWIEIDAPERRKILAASFRPEGTGPFPIVVVLHGTEGFRETHVQLAQDFAKNGFIGVAGSWFGGHYRGVQSPIPIKHDDGIDWLNGPDIKAGNDLSAVKDVLALINAAQTLPSARADRVGVLGHSRGSAIALTTASTGEDLQAVVAAAGYPSGITLNNLKAPILIMHGTADQVIPLQQAKRFESSLQRLGKSVESHYYEGGPHTIPWDLPWSDNVRQHAIEFFNKHLAP